MAPPAEYEHAANPSWMPGPRWNRFKVIYPTTLRAYLDCPHRCRLEYIHRIPYAKTWDRVRAVGNALHKTMELVAEACLEGRPFPSDATLRSVTDEFLPVAEYRHLREHSEDVERVLGWVERGARYITYGNSTILRVEQYSKRYWDNPSSLGHVRFGAKVDLVIRRHGRTGPRIEIVDYKTGRDRSRSQFPPLLTRIALKRRIDVELPRTRHSGVAFTYLWFAYDEKEQIELTRERMNSDWLALRRVVGSMLEETEWPMRPHRRVCSYCPYFQTACTPEMPND